MEVAGAWYHVMNRGHRAGAVHDGLGLRALGGALDGDVPDGVVGEVLHHGTDPGGSVRPPPARQGRGFIDVDVLLTPLPGGPAVGRFAGGAEAFDQRMVRCSHAKDGNVVL